ncbi:MAG: glycosyltransferase family 1 protein [Bacteroidales bacterium]|nr:glycosyltransferase family 1 protein [Bacteroidales bacterium]
MMRIGFDAKRAFYNSRGLGNYSRDTIRILSHNQPDHEYFLYTPKTRKAIEFPLSSNCTVIQPETFIDKQNPTLWRTFRACNKINSLHLDIFHGLSNELPIGIEKTSARSVVTIHDVIFLKFPHLYSWIDQQLYKRKYIRSCRISDKVIAISEHTKKELIELTDIDEQKIDVVYQGCNPIFLKETSKDKLLSVKQKYHLPNQYLLNVGTIEKRKNQELIIHALIGGKFDIPLVIIGKPTEYIKELKSLINKYHLESRIIFLSNVPTEDLPAIYQMAEIFIFPSITEGFGIPILEALHSKVPVITSKGSCFEEAGGPDSYYINHDHVEELIAAIDEVFSNTEMQKKRVDAGLAYAERFSDSTISKSLMNVYKQLL